MGVIQMIVLSRQNGASLYAQLYDALRDQIITGERKAGEKLPSKRDMAQNLNISVNTVDAAYRQLESEGYIQVRPRSGFYVCDIGQLAPHLAVVAAPQTTPVDTGIVRVDFSPSGIAAEKFPLRRWQQLLRACAEEPAALKRTPAEGDMGLRCAIADYLYKARGVQCRAENIIIGAGSAGLLACLSHLLPNSCTFAVENPVYNRAYRHFDRMGHRVVPAQIDHSGVMPEPLEELEEAILYTTPSHQYPLGLCMPMARRIQLLNWCSRKPMRYIIEDDYDSEFRYDTKPIPSLQSIDRHDRVIYLGTFSRSVMPGLRISYMVLPESLMELYRREYRDLGTGASTLEQLVLREFILQGDFARHLNRMRVYYKGQRGFFLRQLAVMGEVIEPIGEAAGHHLAVRVHNGMNEQELCRSALAQGARVYPISSYFMGEMPPIYEKKILLGFGGLSREEIETGTMLLRQAWL